MANVKGRATKPHKPHGQASADNLTKDPEVRKKNAQAQTMNNTLRTALKEVAFDYTAERLLALQPSGLPFYQEYIDKFLNRAIEDVDSLASRQLSAGILNEKLWDSFSGNTVNDPEYEIYKLRKTLFDKQREVFDNDFDSEILVICSRRAGKTELNARLLAKVAKSEKCDVLYLNKTFANAINQIWNIVTDVLKTDIVKQGTSKAEGTILLKNGSQLKFGGMDNVAQLDKYRGFKYKLVIVDEIGHVKNAKYLIEEVLRPATMDYKGSQLVYTGTPPRSRNYATTLWNSKIKKYTWTAADNPFIPDFEGFVQTVCEKKGVDKTDPAIQREYFGNMEAYDTDALIFSGAKTYEELPRDFFPSKIWIGIDWGYVDDNAIVTVAVDHVTKRAFVIAEDVFGKADTDEQLTRVEKAYIVAQSFLSEHGIAGEEQFVKIVADTNQPNLMSTLRKRGMRVLDAYKPKVLESVQRLASEMKSGRCKIKPNGPLFKEVQATVWKRDENDSILPEIDDDTFHPNALHALRYAMEFWTRDFYKKDEAVLLEEKKSTSSPLFKKREEESEYIAVEEMEI